MKIVEWKESLVEEVAEYLLGGGVAVLPTDTIYGLVAVAKDKSAMEKVYSLKSRNPEKKCILLIGDMEDLNLFDIELNPEQKENLEKYWPGKVSVELPCRTKKYDYLMRGTESLSFRFPDDELLCKLLKESGPLIAPSANPEGLEPARDIDMAIGYFGNDEVIYIDAGEKISSPSKLISLLGNTVEVLRG